MFKYNLVIGNSFSSAKQSYTQINYDFVPNSVDKQKNGLLEINDKKGMQEVTVKLPGTDGEDREYNQQTPVKYNQEITKQCVLVVNQDAVGGPTLTLERVSQVVAVRKSRNVCGQVLSNADVPQSFSKPPTVAKRQKMQAPPVQNHQHSQNNLQNPQIMQNSQHPSSHTQQIHKTNQIQPSQRLMPPVPIQNQMPQHHNQNLPSNGNEGNNDGSSSSSGSGSSSSGSSTSGSGSSSSESDDENNEVNQLTGQQQIGGQIGGQMGGQMSQQMGQQVGQQMGGQMGQVQQQQGGLQSFAQNNNPYNAPITSNQPNPGNGTSLGGFASFYNAKPQTAVEQIHDDLRLSSSESEVD